VILPLDVTKWDTHSLAVEEAIKYFGKVIYICIMWCIHISTKLTKKSDWLAYPTIGCYMDNQLIV